MKPVLCSALLLGLAASAACTAQTSTPPPASGTEATPAATAPAPAAPARRPRVSGGVIAGLLVHKVDPVYPIEARSKHLQGAVVLQATIGKDGSVKELTVMSGPSELRDAAVDAVKQWRYKAFLMNHEPVEVDTTIVINFNLSPF